MKEGVERESSRAGIAIAVKLRAAYIPYVPSSKQRLAVAIEAGDPYVTAAMPNQLSQKHLQAHTEQ